MHRADIFPKMRALVIGILELADGGRCRRHNAGRERGREDIGSRHQPHDFKLGMVGNNKAAHRANAFGESADHEIDLILNPLIFIHAAPVRPEKAHRMRLIDQHHRPVFLRDLHHFGKWSDIAKHRINAFQHHQLTSPFGDAAQPPIEILNAIVAEADDLCIAQKAAVVNRGMAVCI